MKRLVAISAVLVAFAILLQTRTASAQTCYVGCNPPQVAAQTGSAPAVGGAVIPAVAPVAAPQSSTQLAFTGADIAGMVVIALALVAGGVIVVRFSRRRAPQQPTP